MGLIPVIRKPELERLLDEFVDKFKLILLTYHWLDIDTATYVLKYLGSKGYATVFATEKLCKSLPKQALNENMYLLVTSSKVPTVRGVELISAKELLLINKVCLVLPLPVVEALYTVYMHLSKASIKIGNILNRP